MSRNRMIVVGGGVVGCSIAWHLARKGADVVLVEERSLAAAASGASAGGVRQQGRDPREMPLAIAAIARWEHLEDELEADVHYYREGYLKLYERDEDIAIAAASVETQRAVGLDITLVAGAALRDLMPGFAPHIVAGTYTANDGHANPTLTTQAYAAAAEREGAEVRTGVPVSGFTRSGNRITGVITPDGEIPADQVVLASGAWTRELVAPLGIDLPIFPAGLQMILTERMPNALRQVVGAHGRPLSLKQLRDGHYLIGGGWPGDVDMVSGVGRTREESLAGSLETAAAIFPVLREARIERSWVGVEGICADEVPIIGPVPGYEGLTVAAGFSGHGFALSPITSQLVAELLVDGAPSIPLDAFRAERFAGETEYGVPVPTAG
jgi:sarcosine oxidase, subunit beta